MSVRIEFASQEEEDWFVGSFVALSAADGKLMRDLDGFPYWAEDENDLLNLLRGMDYNNFGIAFVEDPEDFYDDEDCGEWEWFN